MFESLDMNLFKALQNTGTGLGVIIVGAAFSGGLSLLANRFFPNPFKGLVFPFRLKPN